jgi:hypothetical protein
MDRIVTEMKIIKDANGAIINIGEWQFGHQDETGAWSNPMPDGAVEDTADIVEGWDGGLYASDDPRRLK